MEKYKGFFVFVEQINGKISEVGLELLSKARELADEKGTYVAGILIGNFSENTAEDLISYGANKVFLFSEEKFKYYYSLVYSKLIVYLVKKEKPEALLIGATPLGSDLAPRVAAQLETGLSAHCVDLRLGKDGVLEQVVPGFGGTMMAVIICPEKRPQMATIMPGVFKKHKLNRMDGNVVRETADISEEDFVPHVVEHRIKEMKTTPLNEADVVVCGGYGIENKENWKLLEKLAEILGGAIGATRPAIDEGWADEDIMIGQSGKIVKPKLYIGAGISGAMQHVVGIQNSDVIVVINKDINAPFFELCDYGIVGDVNKVLPVLVEKTRKKLFK